MTKSPCDLLVHGASAVFSGEEVLEGDGLVIGRGKVLETGEASSLRECWDARSELDVACGVVAPGFVDAHVHPAFAEGRAGEFSLRSQGADYQEIAAAGGGILSSVRAVRGLSEEELSRKVADHFRRMRCHGTTACEAKSGYGLTVEEELKSLRAIAFAAEATGMEVFPTFLGAHAVPEEHRENPDDWIDELCDKGLPAVAESGLARAADVFIEGIAFNLDRSRRYLEKAKEVGLALRVHADQFEALGGVELAVELGAESVDHLEVLEDRGLEALALGTTFAGLLPAVPHFLGQESDAPARRLLAAGVRCFVATDFNPGSCPCPSLPEAAHFARRRLALTAEEALTAITSTAADSLGAGDRKGRLIPGHDADLVVLDLPDIDHFGYFLGENPVRTVVMGGVVQE
ncbi:MAG TPA: imidazolonepropionase [Planctomycetes bacterium]|nr:imidazolonepropionase [Planctomycetota bacterium]